MEKTTISKRILASVLSASIMLSSMPTQAFAATKWNDGNLNVKRNEIVQLSEIESNVLTGDETADVTVKITETIDGESKDFYVADEVSEGFKTYVEDFAEDEIKFSENGTYNLFIGKGTVDGQISDAIKGDIELIKEDIAAAETQKADKESEISASKGELLAAQAKEAAAKVAFELAESDYNKAVQDVADKEAALADAQDDLANYETKIEEKKAELAEQKAANEKSAADIASIEKSISDAFAATSKAGYSREEVEECAKNNIHNHRIFNICKTAMGVVAPLEEKLQAEKTKLAESNAAIAEYENYLASNDKEEVKKPFEDAVENAENALADAEATLANKTTAYNEKNAAYTSAKGETAEKELVVSTKEGELETIKDSIASLWESIVNILSGLTASDITYNKDEITYTKGDEFVSFDVSVYDIVRINIVDAQDSIEEVPTPGVVGEGVNAHGHGEGFVEYKVLSGKTMTVTPEEVTAYRFAVEGATLSGSEYVAGPFTEDTQITITYSEIGASVINYTAPEGATIEVMHNGVSVGSGNTVKANSKVDVKVAAEEGYEINSVTLIDKDGNKTSLELTDSFTTNALIEDNYTIEVVASFVGASIDEVEFPEEYVKDLQIFVDDAEYALHEIISDGTGVVKIYPTAVGGYEVNDVIVLIVNNEDAAPTVENKGEYFEFTTTPGHRYKIMIKTLGEGVADVHSSLILSGIDELENAKVYVNGEEATSDKIVPGSEVKIVLTPKSNEYISNIATRERSIPEISSDKGSKVITFTAEKSKTYVFSVTIEKPVVAPNDAEVIVNKYDIKAGRTQEINDVLNTGFDKKDGIELEFEYKAGTVEIPFIDFAFDVWRDVHTNKASATSVAEVRAILNSVSSAISNMVSDDTIKALLNTNANVLHNFGDNAEEDVRATFGGNDEYLPVISASRKVQIKDLREEIELDINEEIEVVYGSYLSNDVLLAKLFEGKKGAVANGVELDNAYNAKFSLEKDMVGAAAGEHEVAIRFVDDDIDYRDDKVQLVKIIITKAPANVIVTKNNIVLYEHVNALQKDYLMKIEGETLLNEKPEHLAFIMGLDANLNDPAKPALFATVDLSKTILNKDIELPVVGNVGNLADYFITTIDKEGDGVTLSELLDNANNIKGLIASLGVDTSILEQYIDTEALKDALKGLYAILAEYSEYGDVYVKFVNSESKLAIDSHGVYVVGAVVTDANYKTAANATLIVVTAEPVLVKFDDVNDNNARQFIYDGTAKAMTAKTYDENGKYIENSEKDITYIYVGLQSDGTPYVAKTAPVHAGTYTVSALYNDAEYKHAGMAVGAMVIWPSDTAEVGVENKVVVYNENNPTKVSIKDMITVLPEGTDAKIAVITAGIDVAGDFSEEGLNALEGVVNIDFPAKADKILEKVVPSAYTEKGIAFSTLKAKLEEIKAGLEGYGIDASAMDQVIATIAELPDSARLTFHNTYYDNVNEKALPESIGAYLVAAVVFDPDYQPEAGAGILLITPDVTKEVLDWDYNDMNGIITRPVLDIVDLGAVATKDSANTAKIEYLFAGLTKDGKLSVFTATEEEIAATTKSLRNGAYTQVAYIWEGLDATMVIAKPIMREFVIVPQQVSVDFAPDEGVENVRKFTYTGSPIKMPVIAKHADGTDADKAKLTITYAGVDSQGNEYNSTKAPTNVGIYTVTAVYAEYEPANPNSLKYVGMNIGAMVIEPATPVLKVDVKDVECTCGCDEATCSTVCAANEHECKCAVDVEKGITVSDGAKLITIVYDKEGNVNILLDGADKYHADNKIDDVIAYILAEIDKLGSVEAVELADVEAETELDKLVEALKEIEKSVGAIKSVSVNGETEYDCGETYTVMAIAFGYNYKVRVEKDTFKVVPPAHTHSGGVATCKTPAKCEGCGESYGTVDPDNHEGEIETLYAREATETTEGYTGDKYWNCCHTLVEMGTRIPAKGNSGTDEPSNPDNPDKPNEPSNPDKPNNPGDSGNGTSNGSSNSTQDSTADTSNILFWFLISIVSGLCAFWFMLPKKRESED